MRRDTSDDDGGLFDRPLWRLWIPMLLIPVAAHRAFVAFVASTGGAGRPGWCC